MRRALAYPRAIVPEIALRPLADAYVTAFILRELLQAKSAGELVEISRWSALLRRLTFGEHKGMLYEEAPLDYLEWIRVMSEALLPKSADGGFTLRIHAFTRAA